MGDDPELTPPRPAHGSEPGIRASRKPRATPPASEPETAAASPSLEAVQRYRAADDERRRQLWRDSATILIGVILAFLVGQTLFPAPIVAPGGSPTPLPTGVVIGSVATLGPPQTLPPPATIGPIINPSLGVDATPTPIPVITMGPTPSPSPSPSPSPGPSASRKPTPKPTVKPSTRPATPTPQSTVTPQPTAAPPSPQVTFTVPPS